MKRAFAFIAVTAVALAAIYIAQRRQHNAPVTANPVVDIVADFQRDVSRVPMKLTRISDAQEIRIGDELAAHYRVNQQVFTPEDEALQQYLQRVGGKLASHAHRKLPYRFHLVPDRDLVNAFALPGGNIYIGTGMLDMMTSEDELAAVLGHEIEHVDHYHCVERVQLEAQMRRLNLDILGELANIPLAVWETGYNKDEEFEADREGLRLAVAAGYSPYGAVKMFERLSELHREYVIHARSPQQELSQLAVQSLVGYFRSHPLPSERLAQTNGMIRQEHWQDRQQLKPFRIEYEVKSN